MRLNCFRCVLSRFQTLSVLYFQGCYTSFSHMVQDNVSILIGIVAGIAVAMVGIIQPGLRVYCVPQYTL